MRAHHWNICICGISPVIRFAAEEFKRLMSEMDPDAVFTSEGEPMRIGLDPALPQPPQVADPLIDDAILIDVGINRLNGKICGDIDFEDIQDYAKAITPVPGGVGPMTIAMLLQNTYEGYILQHTSV